MGYSYVPDTAGGTAFMYHLDVDGKLITNLRLSGETVMKIFTGQISNWDNKAITKDYGAQLPNIPIIPVIRSDGSGATYFFTRWMATEFPAQWNAFCGRVSHNRVGGAGKPCGQTEFYPQFPGAVAQNGSNNVATYITASFGQGAIGYDEYAYALNSHYPVVALENPAGYYVLPTASNVAVALTRAVINEDSSSPDFLQQNLDSVYSYNDPRSYPLSSYSYLIVPRAGTTVPANFTRGDGVTLSTYIDYFLCAGQQCLGRTRLLAAAAEPRHRRAAAVQQDARRDLPAQLVQRLPEPDAQERQAGGAGRRAAAVAVRQGRRAARLLRGRRQGGSGRSRGEPDQQPEPGRSGWYRDRHHDRDRAGHHRPAARSPAPLLTWPPLTPARPRWDC